MVSRTVRALLLVGCALAAPSVTEQRPELHQSFAELKTTEHAKARLSTLLTDRVTYTSEKVNFGITAQHCSPNQQARIKKGIIEALPAIRKAGGFSDRKLWKKWFGSATSLEPDGDVEKRYNNAIAKLLRFDWKNHCCPCSGSKRGLCYKSCGHKGDGKTTLAFVTSSRLSSNHELQYNGIMWCARAFSDMTDKQLGFVAFHEAIHMVSRAGDGANDYSKTSIVRQAMHSPNTARTTAQSYTLYAMQAGMSYKDYEQASAAWSGSTSADLKCRDGFSNCHVLASKRSCNVHGNALRKKCCHACRVQQPPGSTAAKKCWSDNYSNCKKLATSAATCARGVLTNGESVGIVCCKSCERFGVRPSDTLPAPRSRCGTPAEVKRSEFYSSTLSPCEL